MITDAQLDLPGPKIIFVNPAFTQMTGYTASEAIGKAPRILQGPRTDKTVLRRLRQNLEHGESFAGEAINYRKDGTEFDLEWQVAPIRDTGGKITHFVATQHDISERKQVENALRASEERMHLATEATAVGIWEWNVITNQIRWDAQMFRIYGITPTKDGLVEYGTWSSSVLPEDVREQQELLQDTVRRCGHGSREFRIRRFGEREYHHIQSVKTVRTNAQGLAEWVVGTNLDITKRKREEEHLRRMATVVKDSNDAITIQDFEGLITAWNHGAELMYGYGEAEALLMNIERLTIPAKVAEQKEFIRRLIAGEAITSFETQRVTKDGRVLDVLLTVT